jgi:uncharacterized protein (TIGR03083 family)
VLGVLDYPAALIEQNQMFTETVLSAEPETPIPTCPGWSMLQLARHVGRAHRWAAHIIRTRSDVSLDPHTVPEGRPPDDDDGAREWLLACPYVLLDAVAGVGGPDVIVGTLAGRRRAQWWIRRLVNETAVHRADAAFAVAEPYELARALATDAIDEWLDRPAGIPWDSEPRIEGGNVVLLMANDIEASWTMQRRGDTLQLPRSPSDLLAEVQLSGPATDLVLALLRRREAEETRCRIEGDPTVWTTFLARTPFVAPGTG